MCTTVHITEAAGVSTNVDIAESAGVSTMVDITEARTIRRCGELLKQVEP